MRGQVGSQQGLTGVFRLKESKYRVFYPVFLLDPSGTAGLPAYHDVMSIFTEKSSKSTKNVIETGFRVSRVGETESRYHWRFGGPNQE